MKHIFFPALFIPLVAVAVWLLPQTAHALTITPIRYEISGDPGQVVEENMTLVNESKKNQVYYVSFANFEAQGDTGSPTFTPAKDGLGSWITTGQSSINLSAGEQKVVPFKITIPKDAEPGGHFAAIFWGTNSAVTGNSQVSIGTKTGMLILLSVNGTVTESAGLQNFQTVHKQWLYRALPVGFEYRFSNRGGDRVKPTGVVVVRSILGWKVKDVNANPSDGNVLPNTTRKFTPEWAKAEPYDVHVQDRQTNQKYSFTRELKREWHNFALGIFRAKLRAQFGTMQQPINSTSIYFVVFPLELLIVIFGILIPLFFIIRGTLRRYHRSLMRKAEESFKKSQGTS